MDDILQKAWIELSKESVFYSYLKMYFDSLATDAVRTIKVSITPNGNFRITYNPYKLQNKGLAFTKALLKHEIYHIIFGHFFIKIKNKREKGLWNICMDAAVNQYIPELDALSMPMDALLKEGCASDNENLFVAPPMNYINKTAEEYFKWAVNFMEDEKMADLEEVEDKRSETDSHDFNSEISQEMAVDIVSEVISQAYDKSAGDIPSGIEFAVQLMIKKPKVSWANVLRRFFGSSTVVDRYRSILKPNRRYEDQPGWQSEYGPKIAVILDTSGSIIEEEYNSFFSEIDSIAKITGGKVFLIQSDQDVRSVIQYSRGSWKDIVLKGKGSTDMQPAVDYVQSVIRPEGIVVFTDGYVDVPVIKRRVMFVLSQKNNPEFYNESVEMYGKENVCIIQ